jgi:hypothetical protein
MICVADGMVVPLSDAVPGAAAFIDALMALPFGDDSESAELLPLHAASARNETVIAA